MNMIVPGRFVIPEVVSTHFYLKEGDLVADFGAGSGFFLKILSEGVGSEGRVYACEIQKHLVEKLDEYIRVSNLANVTSLWCDLEEINGIKLDDSILDAGILVNTLFMFEQKEVAIKEIGRVIKSEGVLHVVDWSESFAGLWPQPKDVITKDQTVALFESLGFVLDKEYPAGDHHYGLTFRKV